MVVANEEPLTKHARTQHSGDLCYGTKEFWDAVLIREDELRLSPEVQAKYAAAEQREDTGLLKVTEALQRQVLTEFGVGTAAWQGPSMQAALCAMRAAPYKWPELKARCIYHRHQRSREGELHAGHALPPLLLAGLDGARCHLLDGCSHELCVVFAGSYSWPPFRALAGVMASLASAWRGLADFRVVYISEAHAADEWPIRSARYNGCRGPVCIRQHTSTSERCSIAATFVRDFGWQELHDSGDLRVLVDPVEGGDGRGGGPFDAALAPWPLRFYVLEVPTATAATSGNARTSHSGPQAVREGSTDDEHCSGNGSSAAAAPPLPAPAHLGVSGENVLAAAGAAATSAGTTKRDDMAVPVPPHGRLLFKATPHQCEYNIGRCTRCCQSGRGAGEL